MVKIINSNWRAMWESGMKECDWCGKLMWKGNVLEQEHTGVRTNGKTLEWKYNKYNSTENIGCVN